MSLNLKQITIRMSLSIIRQDWSILIPIRNVFFSLWRTPMFSSFWPQSGTKDFQASARWTWSYRCTCKISTCKNMLSIIVFFLLLFNLQFMVLMTNGIMHYHHNLHHHHPHQLQHHHHRGRRLRFVGSGFFSPFTPALTFYVHGQSSLRSISDDKNLQPI